MQRKIQELSDLLLQKANIKDVCALLDLKSNIDDVNKALEDTHDELQGRLSLKEFR